ncbi:hypothetical protein V7087_19135 [Neobacillus niacini]|uniref:hypothetical protein n=1 Tax=Neobacillus niacini TaxID=86668 RepID=UPI0005EFF586|nr:hypothetical protein [Neobacillus niacini]
MLKVLWKLIIIFLSGYLHIQWFPIQHPFRLDDFLVRPIIMPLEFFAASVAFFIGFVFNAQLIRDMLQLTIKAIKKKHSWSYSILLGYSGLIFIYFFLFKMGWQQTLVLFSFSSLYGMISVEHFRMEKGK